MVFSNTGNVSLTVNMGALVTHEQLTEAIKQHNDDANAHGGLLQNLKTQLSTHNTDISSHPAITAMIAKILGATNWQENPVATLKDIKNLLGMGGIVAQRLEENGFVKFANGFTIQWGKSLRGNDSSWYLQTTNFPIAFNNVYAVTTGLPDSAKGPSSNNSDNAIKYTNTTISFARFEHFFIAIGKS